MTALVVNQLIRKPTSRPVRSLYVDGSLFRPPSDMFVSQNAFTTDISSTREACACAARRSMHLLLPADTSRAVRSERLLFP